MEYSILLTEDDADGREVLQKLLRRSGYRVCGAATVQEALDLLTQQDFDLLIADIGLPDRSGVELMYEARKLRPTLLGVALTGFDEDGCEQACRQAGFCEFLLKPIAFEKLNDVIANLVARKYVASQIQGLPTPGGQSPI